MTVGGRCHSGNCRHPGGEDHLPTEAVSSKGGREKQSCLDLEIKTFLYPGGLSQSKKVTKKEMLIRCFLRSVRLMNIKREMKKLFQANVPALSCSLTRARMAGQEPQKVTFALPCFCQLWSTCASQADWNLFSFSASTLSGYSMPL